MAAKRKQDKGSKRSTPAARKAAPKVSSGARSGKSAARSTRAKSPGARSAPAPAKRRAAAGRPKPASAVVAARADVVDRLAPAVDRVRASEAPIGSSIGSLAAAPFRMIERADRALVEAGGEPARPTRASRVTEGVRASDSRGKYVYCIIQTNEPLRFGRLGIGGEAADVHTINYKNIAAVVSDTPIEVHEPTRENVLAHERVNETVMHNHTVIPMSFGTVFKTREDIVELLRSAYDAFNEVLVKMQDKLEFGLKVLWDGDVMLREIEAEDEDVRRLKNEISTQKGSTYFARMQYGRLVDAALQARSERYVADIFEQLRDVSVASRANKPIGDKMIMNAAFLVSRDKESAFDAKVKAIGAKYDKLTFKYTGPWPPYNFVNIRLKLERAKDAK
ncbi:MAG TPA: GvpL/GvpF family gas vesicle protein [Polyangiaceae bacterium]|nr:GvpL/GvpF family gas vesicle protein [Polyangiaceae bacterium]